MPIHKRWGTAGGNVRLLDAKVAKQIEQTGLDGAASCCSCFPSLFSVFAAHKSGRRGFTADKSLLRILG
jgi:hypothetical protein